jgi:hypothetical protein
VQQQRLDRFVRDAAVDSPIASPSRLRILDMLSEESRTTIAEWYLPAAAIARARGGSQREARGGGYDLQGDQSLAEDDGHRAPCLHHLPGRRELARRLIDPEGDDGVAVLVSGIQQPSRWVETEVAGRFALS